MCIYQDLERHPFFLKEIPDDGSELHPATEALQALQWEDNDDTPLGSNFSIQEISIDRSTVDFLTRLMKNDVSIISDSCLKQLYTQSFDQYRE